MQSTPVALVVVHLAKKGIALGASCDLKRLTKQKAKFKALTETLKATYGLAMETETSNTGHEPCVLAKFEDGSTSMILDARDLAVIDGSMEKFEKTLKGKLFLFF
jgi:hypothetical protein